jgi:hypothetical protein
VVLECCSSLGFLVVFLLFEHNLNIAWMLFNFFSLVALLVLKYNFSLLLKWCSNATFLCCSSNVWVVFLVVWMLFLFLATWVFNCYICKLCIAWKELETLLNILLVILLSYLTISNQVPPPTSNLSLLLMKVGKKKLNSAWTIFKSYFLKIWKIIMGTLYVKKIVLFFK